MGIAELVLKYIDVIVNTLIILFIIVWFKESFEELLSGKMSAKYNGIENILEGAKQELIELIATQEVVVDTVIPVLGTNS